MGKHDPCQGRLSAVLDHTIPKGAEAKSSAKALGLIIPETLLATADE